MSIFWPFFKTAAKSGAQDVCIPALQLRIGVMEARLAFLEERLLGYYKRLECRDKLADYLVGTQISKPSP